MIPRLRALNEEGSSSSDSEDDGNKRLSKEAQEEQAIVLYNKTLLMMANADTKDAINIMENLLKCPYLNEDEKASSPIQNQIKLGCLKNLSTVYMQEPHKNLESAKRVLSRAIEMDSKNVNLWIRLGQVALSSVEYYLAHLAFSQALHYSPNHWGCIEDLISLSYVLNDPKWCLKFCALGLEKDAGFLKGLVFRDHIFHIYPSLKEVAKASIPNFEYLMVSTKYEDKWREKFLREANELTRQQCEKLAAIKVATDEKYSRVLSCSTPFTSYTVVEFCAIVTNVHTECKRQGTFTRPIGFTRENESMLSATESREDTSEGGEENENPFAVRRSLSSNDDKENGLSEGTVDGTNEASANETEDYMNSSQSQMEQGDTDTSPKKKSKRDVKWWQLEGKRRSQRVRGHLLPVAPSKTKSENGFAELLRNIIPPSLLSEDYKMNERDESKTSDGQTNVEECSGYFGTEKEIEDVKEMIGTLGTTDIISIVIHLTKFLATNCKRRWPQELASAYLKLYTIYMSHTSRPDVNSINEDGLDHLQSYCFIVLAMLELCAEELTTNGLELLNAEASLAVELNYLYDILSSKVLENKELMLRLKWLQVKHSLALCQAGNRSTCKYEDVLVYLNMLKECIGSDSDLQLIIHTKNDNIISLHEIEKKLNSVYRMQNLNRINELYEAEKYDDVIEILKHCVLPEDTASLNDAKNRYYLAKSYFYTGDMECVVHCAKAIHICLKSRNDGNISDCIALLDEICLTMSHSMTSRERQYTTNAVIQILICNEKKGNPCDSLITTSWCILHSILYHMETEEPALYLEEDSVPNSILVLQMGHEFLSRSGKCTVNNGKFLLYTVEAILAARRSENYSMFEETKHVIEQSIFCLYSHPSRKSKLRYLSEHNTTGINLDYNMCLNLYEYYKPLQLPEFDSYDSISAEVEILLKRILTLIPEELKPNEQGEKLNQFLDGDKETLPEISSNFPIEFKDTYYLIADRNFKNKEWVQAITNYTFDITINPKRFDTWASIALAKGEMLNTRLNSCDDVTLEDLVFHSSNVLKCFLTSLELEPSNMKIRLEFGSFVYSMHSFCSRFLKHHGSTLTFERYLWIEEKINRFLNHTSRCFDPEFKDFSVAPKPLRVCGDPNEQHDEIWMQHYMMGKVMEKEHPVDPSLFLKHYILAGELLHKQGAPYPAKISFYNPPELAIEALEIHYRIHASIISYVERHTHSEDVENTLSKFIELANQSPFMKCKQNRSGENSESKKRKQSVTDDTATKKEVAEVLNDVLSQVEDLVGPSTAVNTSQPLVESPLIWVVDTKTLCYPSLEDTDQKSDEPSKFGKASDADPYVEFKHTEWSKTVSQCAKAMQECIARFPQHHKAYFRLGKIYKVFKKDLKAAKEVLIGSSVQKKKLYGLFADRKANNFFNGVWRNPIDDIDRPGSFAFHMSKSIKLLLEILTELQDHQLLAEIGIQLSKVPDSDKKYLTTSDREQYSQKALSNCVEAARKILPTSSYDLTTEMLLSIYDTFIKLSKNNQKEKAIFEVLQEAYKRNLEKFNQEPLHASSDQILKFYHNLAWNSKPVPGSGKSLVPARLILQNSSEVSTCVDGLKMSDKPLGQMDVSQKKKLCSSKRLLLKGNALKDGGSKTLSDLDKQKRKNKKSTTNSSLYVHSNNSLFQLQKEKDVLCLDLTKDEPPSGTKPIPKNGQILNHSPKNENKQEASDTSINSSFYVPGRSTVDTPSVVTSATTSYDKMPENPRTDKNFVFAHAKNSLPAKLYDNPRLRNISPDQVPGTRPIPAAHQSTYILPHDNPPNINALSRSETQSFQSSSSISPGFKPTLPGLHKSNNQAAVIDAEDYTTRAAKPVTKFNVARKSTGLSGHPMSSSRSSQPKIPSLALNTSPYKQQLKAVSTPSLNYEFNDLKIVRSNRPVSSKVPPIAHSQGVRRLSIGNTNATEPEIIDLTVKSPSKLSPKPTFERVVTKQNALPAKRKILDAATKSTKAPSTLENPSTGERHPRIVAYMSTAMDSRTTTAYSSKEKLFNKGQKEMASSSQGSSSKSSSSKVDNQMKKSYPLPPKKKRLLIAAHSPTTPDAATKDINAAALQSAGYGNKSLVEELSSTGWDVNGETSTRITYCGSCHDLAVHFTVSSQYPPSG